MKKINIIIMVITLSFICFLKCDSKESVKVMNQEMIYDSINYKTKGFRVNLYTSLEFDKRTLSRKDYNDFFVIIQKDTFPLIPQINYLQKESNTLLNVKYFSEIKFQSKEFDNDSLTKIIKESSRIINSKGEEITKKDTYSINLKMAFSNPKKNGELLQ